MKYMWEGPVRLKENKTKNNSNNKMEALIQLYETNNVQISLEYVFFVFIPSFFSFCFLLLCFVAFKD